MKKSIFVIGGYGNCGKRLSAMLAQQNGWKIWVAGRHLNKAKELAEKIKKNSSFADVEPFAIDWQAKNFKEKLKSLTLDLLVNCAQNDGEPVITKACVDLKINYLDLSDDREFVTAMGAFDEIAKDNNIIVLSGAGCAPGLSSVVIDHYAGQFAILREINFGRVLGNQSELGFLSLSRLLKDAGRPFMCLEGGEWKPIKGWQRVRRYYYGDNLGMRWHANVDVPDLALLPDKYPSLKTVLFHTGFEMTFLHHLVWVLSFLRRLKLVRSCKIFARPLMAIRRWFKKSGTDSGGMTIRMRGSNPDFQPMEIKWILVAQEGDDPYVSVIPAFIMVKKILEGEINFGALPCWGLFTLEEFDEVAKNINIYHTTQEKVI